QGTANFVVVQLRRPADVLRLRTSRARHTRLIGVVAPGRTLSPSWANALATSTLDGELTVAFDPPATDPGAKLASYMTTVAGSSKNPTGTQGDLTPPSAPTNLSVTGNSLTSV